MTWLTKKQAVEYLRCSTSTITRYTKCPVSPLPHSFIGNQMRFHKKDLDALSKNSFEGKDITPIDPALIKELKKLIDMFLRCGGHDKKKIYNAYLKAINEKDRPSVILVKTIKGFGLNTFVGKNVTHQKKKIDFETLNEYREKLQIPIIQTLYNIFMIKLISFNRIVIRRTR